MKTGVFLGLAGRLLRRRWRSLHRNGPRRHGRCYESGQSDRRGEVRRRRLFTHDGSFVTLLTRLKPVAVAVALKTGMLATICRFAAPIRISLWLGSILTAIIVAILIAIRSTSTVIEGRTFGPIGPLMARFAVRALLERLRLRLRRRKMRLHLRLRRLVGRRRLKGSGGSNRQTVGQRREAIRYPREIIIVVAVVLRLKGLATKVVRRLLRGCDQAEIMFRMLQEAFRHHDIARRLGVTRELKVFFCDMLSGSANLDVGTVRLKERVSGLGPLRPLLRPRSLLFCPGLIDNPQQSLFKRRSARAMCRLGVMTTR